jgi:ubiquinone/menaquinone biosynthesis C-methylase UbiE
MFGGVLPLQENPRSNTFIRFGITHEEHHMNHESPPAADALLNALPLVDCYDRFYAPIEAAMLAWLDPAPRAQIFDAGCGPGIMVARFAEAVGPDGHVAGLDINADIIAQARQNLALFPPRRVSLHEGSLLTLPFEPGRFDLAWASFVLHHIPDPVAAIAELRRVVKSDGRIVVRESGVPLRWLPFDLGIGAPGLTDRLRVAQNRWFADHRYEQPVEQPYPGGWLQALQDGGCSTVTARTFFIERLPPFSDDERAYLLSSLRLWLDDSGRRAYLDGDDICVLAALIDPGNPYFVLQRADLHVLTGLSLYVGGV